MNLFIFCFNYMNIRIKCFNILKLFWISEKKFFGYFFLKMKEIFKNKFFFCFVMIGVLLG